jgi:hypothetical protein
MGNAGAFQCWNLRLSLIAKCQNSKWVSNTESYRRSLLSIDSANLPRSQSFVSLLA